MMQLQMQLSEVEQGQRERLESIVERGLTSFVEVGNALREIRDAKLYRSTHSTFEDYCEDRWGISRIRGYQLMEAAGVVENVKNFIQTEPPRIESHARPLTRLEPDQRAAAWEAAVESAPNGKVTGAHVERVVTEFKQPHVSHNSGQNEWYTPVEYIEAARAVMGGIDLDPASSEIANKTVQAATYYTAEDDGLSRTWSGRVWMNPPYSQPLIGLFCKALRDEVERGNVSEAITLTNNATETAWFSDLLEVASAICLIRGRVRFVDPDGKPSGAPLQGQIVTYAGGRPDEFIDVFSQFGRGLYVSAGNNSQRG